MMLNSIPHKISRFLSVAVLGAVPMLAVAGTQPKDGVCEVVLIETVDGAQLASYRPADEFLDSVFDGKDGFLKEVDGLPVRVVMCTRQTVLPNLRDFQVVSTGVPLSLSEDFDATDSRLVTIYYKNGTFQYKYSGAALTPEDQAELDDMLVVFNLQPHNLPKSVEAN